MKMDLYYFKMGIPKCVRIVSDKLQIDHTFLPEAGPVNTLPLDKYLDLIKQEIFTEVKILPNNNDAYVTVPEPENKIILNDWITLSDYNTIQYYD